MAFGPLGDFVNKNNALRATSHAKKSIKSMSRKNLRGVLNPTFGCAAGAAPTSASAKSKVDVLLRGGDATYSCKSSKSCN